MTKIHDLLEAKWRPGIEMGAVERSWMDYHWDMATTFETLEYEPGEKQLEFHLDRHRIRQVVGGERAGKSYSVSNDGIAKAVYGSKQGVHDQLIWILGPDYEQPRVEFEYMFDGLRKCGFEVMGKASMPRGTSSTWVARFKELGLMQTKTTSDIKKIASKAPTLILMCEAAQMNLEAYYKARGRSTQRKAPILISGTFEDSSNWFADYYLKWKGGFGNARSFSIPSWENLVIYPGGYNDPEIQDLLAEFPYDLFMERFGAEPHKPHTLIFPEFSYETHVQEWCKFNPDMNAEVAIDPGYTPGSYHVSCIQVHKPDRKHEQVWVVDSIHEMGLGAEQIIKMCKRRPWWKNVTGGVIDIAGRQHHGDRSQVEIWRNKAAIHLRSQPVGIMAGINRHRTFLADPLTKEPRIYFSELCEKPLKEYSLFKRKPDNERLNLNPLPIDRNNHMIKALNYWLYDRYGPVDRNKRKTGQLTTLEG